MEEQPAKLDPANPRAWDRYASCREYADPASNKYDPLLSWCGERAQARPEEKRICIEECPVRSECLTWAIIQGDPHCVYGGLNFGERRKIGRQWKVDGVFPDPNIFPRITPDGEELFRLFTEGTTRLMSATNYETAREAEVATKEPSAEELRAIEEEE